MPIDINLLKKKLLEEGLIKDKALAALEKKAQSEKMSLDEMLFKQEVISDEKLGTIIA